MPIELGIVILLAINAYIAVRYAHQNIGPDEAAFMMWGFTGARLYYDYYDCKPPGIHLWFWLLAKLTRRNIFWAKFLHHLAIGMLCIYVTLQTGSFGAGLLATAILQSAWLCAFQSFVDSMSGGLLLAAMVSPPWIGLILIGLACLVSVKLGFPALVFMALSGWWLQIGAGALIAGVTYGLLRLLAPDFLKRAWYGAITIPARMRASRKWFSWSPILARPIIFVVPCVVIGLLGGAPTAVWATALAYTAFNMWGRVHRPNHWLPLAVLAAGAPDPVLAGMVLLTDALSARFYLGDVWETVYPALAPLLKASRQMGESLRDRAGEVWVNTWQGQIYIYAKKRPQYGIHLLEVDVVTPELASARDRDLADRPPAYIVLGPNHAGGSPKGYRNLGELKPFVLLG